MPPKKTTGVKGASSKTGKKGIKATRKQAPGGNKVPAVTSTTHRPVTRQSQVSNAPESASFSPKHQIYKDVMYVMAMLDSSNKDEKSQVVQNVLKYFSNFHPYRNLVNYLHEITKKRHKLVDATTSSRSGMMTIAGPFCVMALFYFQKVMSSELLRGLCD